MRARHLLLALTVAMLPLALSLAAGCNCFPPEAQAQTARETLRVAQAAYYAHVMALTSNGGAQVRVVEPFKGPAAGATIEVQPPASSCDTPPFAVDDEVLVLAFDAVTTACDLHPREHYLLDALRAVTAAPGLNLTSPPSPPTAPPRR